MENGNNNSGTRQIMASSSSSYQMWTETWIEAPKVQVGQKGHSSERGLFCTEIIHPGERILWVPCELLIGQDVLQKRGFSILQRQVVSRCEEEKQPTSVVEQEDFVLGMIEELRRMVLGTYIEGGDNREDLVKRRAEDVQYEWREDDAVAMYLLACRKILQQSSSSNTVDHKVSQQQQQQGLGDFETKNDSALLVKAVSPIIESDTLLVDAVQVEYANLDNNNDASDESVLAVPHAEPEPETNIPAVSTPLSSTVLMEQQHGQPCPKSPTDSHFSFLPHIQMLPESYPTSPIFYNADELARIEGTNCHGFCTRMLQQMESDWSHLQAVLEAYHHAPHRSMTHRHDRPVTGEGASPDREIDGQVSCPCCCLMDPSAYTLDDYKWALCTIYSRSTDFFHDTIDENNDHNEKKHHRVIAPLLDMMNHEFRSDLSHFMDAQGNISVFNGSTRTFQPGDEIFLCYGNFPNEKLLLVYGFCVPDNLYDAVQIYAPIRETDPFYQPKTRLLQTRCGIVDVNEPHGLACGRDEVLPSSLMSVLRLVGIQSADEILKVAKAALEAPEDGIGMISVENERSALLALGQALHSLARTIALNLISDEGLKGASNLSPILSTARKESLGTIVEHDAHEKQHRIAKNSSSIQQEAPLQARERQRSVGDYDDPPNVHNAKLLCISEYRILQAALADISDRLNKLEDLDQMMQ